MGVHIMSASRGARGCSWAPNVHNMTPGASGDLVVRYGVRFVAVTMENVSPQHALIEHTLSPVVGAPHHIWEGHGMRKKK